MGDEHRTLADTTLPPAAAAPAAPASPSALPMPWLDPAQPLGLRMLLMELELLLPYDRERVANLVAHAKAWPDNYSSWHTTSALTPLSWGVLPWPAKLANAIIALGAFYSCLIASRKLWPEAELFGALLFAAIFIHYTANWLARRWQERGVQRLLPRLRRTELARTLAVEPQALAAVHDHTPWLLRTLVLGRRPRTRLQYVRLLANHLGWYLAAPAFPGRAGILPALPWERPLPTGNSNPVPAASVPPTNKGGVPAASVPPTTLERWLPAGNSLSWERRLPAGNSLHSGRRQFLCRRETQTDTAVGPTSPGAGNPGYWPAGWLAYALPALPGLIVLGLHWSGHAQLEQTALMFTAQVLALAALAPQALLNARHATYAAALAHYLREELPQRWVE